MAEVTETKKEAPKNIIDPQKTAKDYYFDSYSHFGIHEEMLKDYVRTETYRRAIVDNPHIFQDKIVLDVGCGTGILSMFAAKAGAKHVYGVDCADIVKSARQIVAENGLSDKVTIIQGKVEDIELPEDVKEVDIIISEWMGYFLLYESMMDTVLVARDKWLRKGGMLFPDKAKMFICGIEDSKYRKEKLNFWDNVYGYKMSCIRDMALTEPLVDVVPPNQVISQPHVFREIDLYTVKIEDLDFNAEFELNFIRQDFCHAVCAWFDVTFSKTHNSIGFTTAPNSEYTHWKQTVFYLTKPILAYKGQSYRGKIDVQKNQKNPRNLNIELSIITSSDTEQKETYVMR